MPFHHMHLHKRSQRQSLQLLLITLQASIALVQLWHQLQAWLARYVIGVGGRCTQVDQIQGAAMTKMAVKLLTRWTTGPGPSFRAVMPSCICYSAAHV
jgi:hypothetical protein